jgi:hypothetical protein
MEEYEVHTLLVYEDGDVKLSTNPNSGLDRLYRRSGRRDNDIIETTHKATDIATLNRTLTTDTYLFAMPNRNSRKILAGEFSEEAAEESANLPDYVYIHFHNRTGEFQVVNDPQEWYVDLTRPLSERERLSATRQVSSRTPIWSGQYGQEG